jgi:hypothetical protein
MGTFWRAAGLAFFFGTPGSIDQISGSDQGGSFSRRTGVAPVSNFLP